ncbi:arsenic efflux protein [bacterium]|nr:arsenic efflux protein [bacterium]
MNEFWNFILHGIDFVMNLAENLIEPIEFLPDFLKDALIDSLNLVPFLFLIFILIEVIEQYFTKKKHLFVFFIKKIGPLFGSLFASIPQCGFSVIASTVYTRRLLSRGTLVSVYLATSDEAIPVLLTYPQNAYIILPIIIIKIILAIIVGYIVDWIITYKAKEPVIEQKTVDEEIKHEEGCCHHHLVNAAHTKDFWIHPLKHTLNIFVFILGISIVLSFLLSRVGTEEAFANYFLINSPLQPFLVSLVGLIPNCAISVMLAMLFVKNTISIGSLLAGLCTSGGLGILVLLRRNGDKKDTALIIATLVVVGTLVGLVFQYNLFHINDVFKVIGIQL